ncbi:ABC transporter permease [Bosea robiniae]|uniref:Peptide/nickel transport system permease protein n=1 Tax=Bosea robiniae TaxID=1036780 RepID=A0ABY0NNE1_9HYPH|nr:ABC transporter permease [Bosea robiniae]SDF81558.1 peptide/nickel transport system permease protein [Bosea robiniae]
MSALAEFWRRFSLNAAAVVGLVFLLLIVAAAIFGPALYPVDPYDMIGRPSQPPSARFPLGTDVSGRDILAGLIGGARVSLLIGLVASFGATVLGVTVGALAGYRGGWTDAVLMRLTDFFLTIPSFVLAVVIIAIFGPSIVTVTAAIAVVSWPPVARLARAEFMAQRDREYVQACRALGMSGLEIATRQIMPNALPPVIVVSSLLVATAILTESGLSFLGLADPDLISWGYMIGVGRTVLRTAWWMPAIPGLAILITVLCINLVGEGLNDALNPRLRQR